MTEFDLLWRRLTEPIRDLERRIARLESRPSRAEEAGAVALVSSLPAAGIKGRIVFDLATGKFYGDTGTAWVAFH